MVFVGHIAVELLKASLSESAVVVTPHDEEYPNCIKRWSAAAEKSAGVVVFPSCPEDVSKAVLFSSKHNLELAVAGGGHATSGSSSTDGGLCIDLSHMREVTVDTNNMTITAQGGATWADVDKEAEAHGLAAVGGTVNHTGIGGLTLGGGYGYLMGQQGLVIDNLLSVDFVLAEGSLVTASDTQNKDLFWAARGAGSAFGVATSFVYRAHKQEDLVWGGMLTFAKDQLDQVIAFADIILTFRAAEATMIVCLAMSPKDFTPVDRRKPLCAVAQTTLSQNTTKAVPYSQMNTLLNVGMEHGLRRSMKGSAFTYPLHLRYASYLFDNLELFVRLNPDAVNTVIVLEFFPYWQMIKVPQTATAFANRGAYGNLLFIVTWTKEENDEECRYWARDMSTKAHNGWKQSRMSQAKDDVTKSGVGEYHNYDGIGTSGEMVFGINFPRLVEIKKKYDPRNVFCKGPQLLA